MDPYALLVITRTQSLAECLRAVLDAEQHRIRWVPSTAQALQLGLVPSILILELPSSGGWRTVNRLKSRFDAPVLALVRAGMPIPDQVEASIRRPFQIEQLVDLIHNTLMASAPHVVQAAGMSLDTRTGRLQIRACYYQLPPIACQIMALLMGRAGAVVSREELFRRVWHSDDGDPTRVLDVHIATLRRLVEHDPRRPRLIRTERGLGYRLQPPDFE